MQMVFMGKATVADSVAQLVSIRDYWQEPWSRKVRRELNAVMTYAEVSVPEEGSEEEEGKKAHGPASSASRALLPVSPLGPIRSFGDAERA